MKIKIKITRTAAVGSRWAALTTVLLFAAGCSIGSNASGATALSSSEATTSTTGGTTTSTTGGSTTSTTEGTTTSILVEDGTVPTSPPQTVPATGPVVDGDPGGAPPAGVDFRSIALTANDLPAEYHVTTDQSFMQSDEANAINACGGGDAIGGIAAPDANLVIGDFFVLGSDGVVPQYQVTSIVVGARSADEAQRAFSAITSPAFDACFLAKVDELYTQDGVLPPTEVSTLQRLDDPVVGQESSSARLHSTLSFDTPTAVTGEFTVIHTGTLVTVLVTSGVGVTFPDDLRRQLTATLAGRMGPAAS